MIKRTAILIGSTLGTTQFYSKALAQTATDRNAGGGFLEVVLTALPFLLILAILFIILKTASNRRKRNPVPVGPSVAENAGKEVGKLSGSAVGYGFIGGLLGFAVGYVTRPSLLGVKVPFTALYEAVPPEFSDLQMEFQTHMLISTLVGFVAAFALHKMINAKR
jgi:di/tricarboxylate transporter